MFVVVICCEYAFLSSEFGLLNAAVSAAVAPGSGVRVCVPVLVLLTVDTGTPLFP